MNQSHPSSLSKRSLLRCAIVAAFVALPRLAFADLPRPPGWEPTCTLEKEQQKGGGPCEQCRGWQDPDPCQKGLETKGFTRRCTEGGAGSYVAVWCKSAAGAAVMPNSPATSTTPASNATSAPNTPPPVAPAADNRKSGGLCSVHTIGQDKHDANIWALVAVGVGLGFMRRRGSVNSARQNDRTMRKNALP